jgi:hypothetical protein
MAKHRSAVSVFCRVHNVGSVCNAGGGSILHTRMNAAARLMQIREDGPENWPAFPEARVKHTARASSGATSAAHSTAHAPLQPHLHFLHATPRHTLHYPRSPAPRPVGHVGRRGGQSLARERHTGENEAHSPTRRTFSDNAAEGWQLLMPTVLPAWRSLRKKTRLCIDETERTHDLRAKLRWRQQFAAGEEGRVQMSAGEAIGK